MTNVGESSKRRRKSVPQSRRNTRSSRECASESREDMSVEDNSQDLDVEEVTEVTGGSEVRPIIHETIISRDFMLEHALDEVVNLLVAQGWGHLFSEEVLVNEDIVREFYQNLVIEEKGSLVLATFTVNGETESVSHKDLGRLLNVPSEGYAEYVKGVWPASIAKAEVILRVGEDPTNSSKQGNALKLRVLNRTLHRLVCTSITPRKQKHGVISYQDFLLLDKILKMEQVCLPKLILRHMQFSTTYTSSGLPYPGIIKRILESRNMYSATEEKVVTSMLNMEAYEKLSWRYATGKGWYLTKPRGPAVGESSHPVVVEDNAVSELLLMLLGKMDSLEKLVTEGLARDSAERVNLTLALEKNVAVLTIVLGSIKKDKRVVAAPVQSVDTVKDGASVELPEDNLPVPMHE